MSSIRSSSGVSSTSSLSHNSDLESSHDLPESRVGGLRTSPVSGLPASPSIRPLPDVLIAVSEPDEKDKDNVARHLIRNSQAYSKPVPDPRPQKKLISLRNLTETDNLPSEDEEFDSLAYQRATGSMKLRRNKVDVCSESNNKAVSRDDSTINQDRRETGERLGRNESNGSKKPKDLLNFLLTDGSIESS